MAGTFLIGKTINEILIAKDKKALLFRCVDGDHIAKADADCCSSTWVEAVSVPGLGFPCVVTGVEDLEMPELPTRDDQDYVQFYGLKISSDKGEIVIDYRNESNGYYGGNLSWPGDSFYGGVYGQQESDEDWAPVVE